MREVILIFDHKDSKVRLCAEGYSFYLEHFMYESNEKQDVWVKIPFDEFFGDATLDTVSEIVNRINKYIEQKETRLNEMRNL